MNAGRLECMEPHECGHECMRNEDHTDEHWCGWCDIVRAGVESVVATPPAHPMTGEPVGAPTMRLWLVKMREGRYSWDDVHTVVVRAADESHARHLASRVEGQYRDYRRKWLDPAAATCKVIPAEGPGRVIATAMNRG